MKKSLFLYLFVIAVLMNVFTYAYFSKKAKSDVATLQTELKKANDSVIVLYNKWDDEAYFSLQHNQNAQDYLENYDVNQLIPFVTNEIMELNGNPKGNPLVPYEQINAQKFIVNKVKVLNHRWIIADFSDGKVWGEVLLKYFIEADNKLTFERIESQLYQPQMPATE